MDLAKEVFGLAVGMNRINAKAFRKKTVFDIIAASGTCSDCGETLDDSDIIYESGEFDADGPTGTIKGNLDDLVYSSCCEAEVDGLDEPKQLDFDN